MITLGASEQIAEQLLSVCNDSLEMAINMHMEGVDVGENDNNGVSHSNNSSERPQNSDNNAGPSRSTSKTSKSDSDTEGNVRFQYLI